MKQAQGFVAGTLVHTDKGLVPIEQIKVGDMVLSKPESGESDDVNYQKVKKNIRFSNVEIYEISYASTIIVNGVEEAVFSHDFLTKECSIWVVGLGWMKVKELTAGDMILCQNSCQKMVFGVVSLHKTCVNSIAYSFGWGADDKVISKLIDLRGCVPSIYFGNTTESITDSRYIVEGEGASKQGVYTLINRYGYNLGYGNEKHPDFRFFGYSYDELFNSEDNYGDVFLLNVYNIELECCHTYFVGEGGIWVHNNSLI
jgi:hypothetical protein